MAKVRNNAVVKEAKNEYKKYVTCVEEGMKETFLTDVEIKMKHLDAQKKALDHFRQHQMGYEESNGGLLNDLNNVFSLIYCILNQPYWYKFESLKI